MVVIIMIVIGLAVFATRLIMAPEPAAPQPVPEITTTYIHPVNWPPQTQILNKPFTCSKSTSPSQTSWRHINGRVYCITTTIEGAAGSTYTEYTYTTATGDQTIVLTFTLKAVQCANYDDPEKTACETERAAFNIDPIIDQIAQSFIADLLY